MLFRRNRAVLRFVVLLLILFVGGCQMSGIPFADRQSHEQNQNTLKSVAVKVVEKSAKSGAVTPSTDRWYSGLMQSSLTTKIEQLLTNNQLVEAEGLLRQRLQQNPKDIQSRTNLGILLAKSKRHDEAVEQLQQVVEVQPSYCPAQSQLAQLFKNQYDIELAQAAYLTCLEANPSYLPALLNVGVLNELYLGDLDAALMFYSQYQQALLEPDEQVAHWITDLNRRIAIRSADPANDSTQLAEVALP